MQICTSTGKATVNTDHSRACTNAHRPKEEMVVGADGVFDATEFQKGRIMEISEQYDLTATEIVRKVEKECKKEWKCYTGMKQRSVSYRVIGYLIATIW